MAYDPSLCMLNFYDGNWLFTLPNQCIGQTCSWNVYDMPFYNGMPSSFDRPLPYLCDNQLHNLNWTDGSYHPGFNRYSCACGAPLNDYEFDYNGKLIGCNDRCNRPWQAAFGKQCNLITSSTDGRGVFTNPKADSSQGVCENIAGTSTASNTSPSSSDSNVLKTIDEIGITYICNGKPFGKTKQSICTCDGSLPEEAFGKKVTNRNPCNLDTSKEAALTSSPSSTPPKWIAAPIVIGSILIISFSIAFLFHHKRRKRSSQTLEPEIESIALQEFPPTPSNPIPIPTQANSTSPLHPLSPSQSNPSTATADSGIGLLTGQPESSKAAAAAAAR